MYKGMNIDIVLPKRSSVYFLESLAICSRYGSAAGEIKAIKSSTSQCCFPRALRTSASVFLAIRSVVSSQPIFCNSSENIFCKGDYFLPVFLLCLCRLINLYHCLYIYHKTLHGSQVNRPKAVNERFTVARNQHDHL